MPAACPSSEPSKRLHCVFKRRPKAKVLRKAQKRCSGAKIWGAQESALLSTAGNRGRSSVGDVSLGTVVGGS